MRRKMAQKEAENYSREEVGKFLFSIDGALTDIIMQLNVAMDAIGFLVDCGRIDPRAGAVMKTIREQIATTVRCVTRLGHDAHDLATHNDLDQRK